MPALNELYENYRDQAEFWMVYIAEAHASDVWQVAANERDEVVFATPANIEERTELAAACVRDLGIEFPAVVDDFENSVEKAYTAWPDRLYVIDAEGRVAYKSEPGPFGFRPGGVETTLERLLGQRSKSGSWETGRAAVFENSFLTIVGNDGNESVSDASSRPLATFAAVPERF